MKGNVYIAQTLTKLLFLLFLTAFATGLSAQVRLSVQGLLKNSDGTSLTDGNKDLKFRFYDAETGGAALATETVTTEINGGVYSAILGSGGGLDMLPFDVPYYVSVAVDNGTELLPRIALSAAPYAISLQGAHNKFPSTGTVKADALDVAGAVNAPGAVNAGSLNVTGNATLSGTTNTKTQFADGRIYSNDGFGYHNSGTGVGTGLFFDGSSKKASIYTEGNVRFHAWDDNKNYYRASAGHIFDIGDVNVTGTVRGGSFQRNGSNQGMFFDGGGGTDLSLRLASGGDRILIGNNGITYNEATEAHTFGVDGRTVLELRFPFDINQNTEDDYANTSVIIRGLQRGPGQKNVQWDPVTGRLSWDNSSRLYKSNITPLEDDFAKILQVQPKIYDRPVSKGKWEIGYIAEEIDSIGLHHIVEYTNGIVDGVDYEKMILYAIEVLKTQHADIEKLKAEVAALTAEKNALRTENTSIRTDAQNQQANFGKQLDELSRRLKSLETAASNR